MEDFFIQNSIYVVLAIVLVIFTGLFIYLFRLERKLSRLEQSLSPPEESKKEKEP